MSKETIIEVTPVEKKDDTHLEYTETKIVKTSTLISYTLTDLIAKKANLENAVVATQVQKTKDMLRHDGTIAILNDQIDAVDKQVKEAKQMGIKEIGDA